jgi:hypothetical protein
VEEQGEEVGRELRVLAEHLDDCVMFERRHAGNATAFVTGRTTLVWWLPFW